MTTLRPPAARTLAAVAVWALLVAAASGLVWTVIAAVGEEPGADVAVPARTGPAASPAPTREPSPATTTLTWTGAAGSVTTRCTGNRIELAGASASADGYVVEVDDRGPGRVRVEFEGRGDETVPETRVEARCVAGRPSYDVGVER